MKSMKESLVIGVVAVIFVLTLFGARASATGSDKLVFVRGGNIWIANPNGSQERQLTFSGQDGSPSLSPDGKWVIYHSGKDRLTGYGQLYLLSTSGGAAKKFDIKDIQMAQDPSFSFDGNGFVFVGLANARSQGLGDNARVTATMSISMVDLVNMKFRTVMSHPNTQLENGYIYDAPAFSPDQTLVVFQHSASDVSGGFEIVDLKGKSLFHYPKDPMDATPYWRPRFSADGTHILCFSPSTTEGAPDMVYTVDIRKGKKRRITEGANPTFVEGGRAIVFEQYTNHWSNGTKPDLWYLKLGPGGFARKIISNGSQPSD
jgi:Tol biopolymer transport system component